VPAYGPQNDVTLKMPAFEWVHVQLHQQKGMISLSPPTICNSAERTMATLGRLMSLLSPFDVVIWMTDGWPLYESRLKGKLHVISKRYTQRIERHNLNLRQHLARLGRKSLSFSKSVELHDKVIGHYLNIKHYQ
ncbi:IS1 family transposase, partial [Escherichia coli]|uniref:IS1 family transposase n=1 Tax=Escherichia coli TaxID=562 RepID=UPI00207717F8